YNGGKLASGRVAGSEFRGDANQEAHCPDLKQISLRETRGQEQRPCNVQMHQASTYQRDPTDVVGNPSDQLQTSDMVHGEILLGRTEQRTGTLRFPARDGQPLYVSGARAS